MIQVDSRQEELFLTDSVHKNLTIEIEPKFDEARINDVNFYTGDIYDSVETTPAGYSSTYDNNTIIEGRCNVSPSATNFSNLQNLTYKNYKNYIYVSYRVRIVPDPADGYYPQNITKARISYYNIDTYSYSINTPLTSDECLGAGAEVGFFIEANKVTSIRDYSLYSQGDITTSKNFKIYVSKIQIRLLDSNTISPLYVRSVIKNNIGIDDYINNKISNITNECLIQESFSLTESLCSQQNLKFGLCESAHCEFEIVDRSEKFNGRTIKPYISVLTPENFDYSGINFITSSDSWSNNWDNTTLRGYYINLTTNSLYFAYADYVMLNFKIKFSDIFSAEPNAPTKFYIGIRVKTTKDNYRNLYLTNSVAEDIGTTHNSLYDVQAAINDYLDVYATLPTNLSLISLVYGDEYIKEVCGLCFEFANEAGVPNTTVYSTTMITYFKEVAVYIVETVNSLVPEYNENSKTSDTIPDKIKGVPLGVFKISEVKKNHTYDTIKKSITAYDGLDILNQDIGDWLTKYMTICDTANKACSHSSSYSRFGVEYARQLYSTYHNALNNLGIEDEYEWTTEKDEDFTATTASGLSNSYNYVWPVAENRTLSVMLYTCWSIWSSDPSGVYKVTTTPFNGLSDKELYDKYFQNYAWDTNYNGISQAGSVFIDLCDTNGNVLTKILCDSGDLFYVPKEIYGTQVHIINVKVSCNLCGFNNTTQIGVATSNSRTISHYKIEKMVNMPKDTELVNSHLRLVYYNYGTQELGSFSSSVSGRDVIQSLLEVNGCFFHMNRYGKPEIIYASKAGLYPSETLYPSLNLYPRGTKGPLLSMGRYISMECDDYIVENYGKIQIKTQSQVKSGESICSYEYTGDENAKNTYIIEDNIFYCSEGTVYEYGSQPEVDEMLKNLFSKISHLTYTPHTTKLRGLPFMECGDRVNLITKTSGMESFIFKRTLKGIHALMDTYEAEGDEYNEALNTFDYNIYTPE